MAKQIGEDTKVTLDLKTIGMGIAGLAALIGMWFALQADIALAMELPEPADPEITRMEFDMKDQLVRQTIMTTQEDVSELKEDLDRIEEKIDKLQKLKNYAITLQSKKENDGWENTQRNARRR